MIRVELLQNEVTTWPSTMLRKDSQKSDNARQFLFGVSWADSMWAWALCANDSVVHLTTLSGNLWAVTVLWVVCAYPNFVSVWLPYAVTWRSTKLQKHTGPTTLLSDSLSTFPFWEAERRNRHAIYQANVKPQKETLPFMSKTQPFSHIPLIDIWIWGCCCSQFQVSLLLRNDRWVCLEVVLWLGLYGESDKSWHWPLECELLEITTLLMIWWWCDLHTLYRTLG